MLTVRVQVKFRAFGITFASVDETFPVPIPVPGAIDLLLPSFSNKLFNKNGVTLTLTLTK